MTKGNARPARGTGGAAYGFRGFAVRPVSRDPPDRSDDLPDDPDDSPRDRVVDRSELVDDVPRCERGSAVPPSPDDEPPRRV
jgi:hypothetical protein